MDLLIDKYEPHLNPDSSILTVSSDAPYPLILGNTRKSLAQLRNIMDEVEQSGRQVYSAEFVWRYYPRGKMLLRGVFLFDDNDEFIVYVAKVSFYFGSDYINLLRMMLDRLGYASSFYHDLRRVHDRRYHCFRLIRHP